MVLGLLGVYLKAVMLIVLGKFRQGLEVTLIAYLPSKDYTKTP